MRVAAVIMECNPFHEGHRYILEQARKITGASYVIVVMSGDFVQRGEPAVFPKERRVRDVLENGADLVLELPAAYATGGADYFARGAVTLLARLHVVTDLVFGSACGETRKLADAAAILQRRPEAMESAIRDGLSHGLSYPAAQAKALQDEFGLEMPQDPNDSLAIEYLKAIDGQKKMNIGTGGQEEANRLLPHAVRRVLPDCASDLRAEIRRKDPGAMSVDAFSSALLYQLSTILYQEHGSSICGMQRGSEDSRTAANFAQDHVQEHTQNHAQDKKNVCSESSHGLADYTDVSPELANRIENLIGYYDGFSSFASRLKTKNYTYTRISRALLHILLGIRKEDMSLYEENGLVGYARVLGFRKDASSLVSKITAASEIPLILRLGEALAAPGSASMSLESPISLALSSASLHQTAGKPLLPPAFRHMLWQDIYASELYDRFLHLLAMHGSCGQALRGEEEIRREASKPLIVV